jgi:gluconate kinase
VFLTNDIPKDLLLKAKAKGFKIIVLRLTLEQLNERNTKRMNEGAAGWLESQLDYLDSLMNDGLVDGCIDGSLQTEQIASKVIALASNRHK